MKRLKLNIQMFANGSLDLGTNTSFNARVVWSSTSNGSSANSSNVTATLQFRKTDGYTTTGRWSGSLNIDGEERTFSWQGSVNGWVDMLSFTKTVGHNSNGTKTCYIKGVGIGPSGTTLSGVTLQNDTYVTLDYIPREAQITNAPNFNDEENPTITYSNPAGNNVNSLQACISLTGARDDIRYRDIPKLGSSYTFELTSEERETLRNASVSNKLNVIFFVTTIISGTTFISVLEKTMSIVNANPDFNDFEFADVNPTTLALTGNSSINVNGYSNIKATISSENKANALKSAIMSKYRFVIDNQSTDIIYADDGSVFGTINKSTSGIYTMYAIDSRGNTTPVTKVASSVIDYTNIYLDSLNCYVKRNSNGVGTGAILTINGNIWNQSFGLVTNSIQSVVYEFKKTSDSNWITGTTTIAPVVEQDGSFSFEGEVGSDNQDFSWDLQSSYDFRIIITDKLSSVLLNLTPMSSARPHLSFADDGMGIMCDYDENVGGLLQVGGKRIDNVVLTEEVKIGTFFDGNQERGLYRKMIVISSFPNATTEDYLTGINNLDFAIRIYGNADSLMVNGNRPDNTTGGIGAWIAADNDNKLRISTGNTDRSSYSGYVVIEYTKTTD